MKNLREGGRGLKFRYDFNEALNLHVKRLVPESMLSIRKGKPARALLGSYMDENALFGFFFCPNRFQGEMG